MRTIDMISVGVAAILCDARPRGGDTNPAECESYDEAKKGSKFRLAISGWPQGSAPFWWVTRLMVVTL